jgi:hypothetical protein
LFVPSLFLFKILKSGEWCCPGFFPLLFVRSVFVFAAKLKLVPPRYPSQPKKKEIVSDFIFAGLKMRGLLDLSEFFPFDFVN